jgi:hypothetical protein
MTECEKLHSDLKAYLDGQLSPAARIALRLHLNRCAPCRKELEEMRLLGTRMRAADSLEMSDVLRTRILASIPTTAPDKLSPGTPKWRERPVLIWGASASAVLAWFILYPAMSSYQNAPPKFGNTTSNTKQIGLGSLGYLQDYDEQTLASKPQPRIAYSDGAGSKSTDQPNVPDANGIYPSFIPMSRSAGSNDAYQPPTIRGTLTPPTSENIKQPAAQHAMRQRVPPQQSEFAMDGHVRQHNGPVQTLMAQSNGRNQLYEKVETDSSRSSTIKPAESAQNIRTLMGEDLPTERQVHKDASLTIEVANAEQQSEAVERLVKESKGYVAQNQLTTAEDNTRTASLTCKVPVDQFDTVMGQLTRLGVLKGKTLSGEDITEKVSDEQETGHVLRADIVTTEEKLKERRRHSETVRDEETLRHLRIRVAQSQARLKMLTRFGTLSEITVELNEKPKNAAPAEVKPSSPFMQEVSGTGQAAAHSFLMALRLPIQLLVWIVVYSPLWGLLFIAYRRMTR